MNIDSTVRAVIKVKMINEQKITEEVNNQALAVFLCTIPAQ